MILEVFNSGNSSELIKQLLITFRKDPYVPKTLFSVKLMNVKKGDVLLVLSHGQLTLPSALQYNAMLCWQLQLAKGPNPSDLIEELTEARGTNASPPVHHQPLFDGTAYSFKQDFTGPEGVYLNLIVYSASSGSNGAQYLDVDQDYGNLNGILFRQ